MLEEKIYNDYLLALKERDRHKIEFLSFIRSELKNLSIQLRKDKLSDEDVLSVLNKQRKRLEETKESVISTDRHDLIEKVDKEISLLNEYLPLPLTEAELIKIIEEKIQETNALSLKDMGKIMKTVLAEVGLRADPKRVSELVKNKLSS